MKEKLQKVFKIINEEKTKIVLLVSLVTVTGVLFGEIIFPLQKNMLLENQQNLILKQNELNEVKLANDETGKNRLNTSLSVQMDEFNRALPSRSNNDEFLSILERSSRASSIIVTSISPVKENAPTDGYVKNNVEVTVVGSFNNTLKFFNEVTKEKRFSIVNSFEMSPSNGLIQTKATFSIFSLN